MHHFIICVFEIKVQKRLSWVVTSVTSTFNLILTFCMDITSVIGNFMIRWWEHSEKGVTYGRMDRAIHRAAWSQLKKTPNLVAKILASKFGFVPDCILCLGEQPSLAHIMVRQLFCVKPLCHPVLTSPINHHEHISVNFYLKMQQLSIFFPSCCCDLTVVPGLLPAYRLPRPLREGDPAPVSPRLHERSIRQLTQRLMSDQYWS